MALNACMLLIEPWHGTSVTCACIKVEPTGQCALACAGNSIADQRPWLRPHIATPAPLQRKMRMRPLIYVYDLPAEFNSRMLQYRLNKACLLSSILALQDSWTACYALALNC